MLHLTQSKLAARSATLSFPAYANAGRSYQVLYKTEAILAKVEYNAMFSEVLLIS